MAYIGNIAEIPVGLGGLNGTQNPSLLKPEHLVRANSISYEAGVVKKEGGATKYSTAAVSGTANIIGGWDWWPTATVQKQVVVTDGGEFYKDDGAGTFNVLLETGLTNTANQVPVFVDAGKEAAANNRKLFILTGDNQVFVLSGDGATTAPIATPAADWATIFPTCGCIHQSRFMGAGNANDPHRVYYSTITNHEDMTGAGSGSIAVYPGVGRKIVALVPFKGLLVVFKYPVGIYFIDTSDATATNWSVQRISDAVGAAGPLCVTAIENDLLFIAPDGQFHLLSAVVAQGSFGSRNLSIDAHMDDYVEKNLNLAKLVRAKLVFYPQKLEAIAAVPSIDSSVLDMRLVLDFSMLGLPRFRYSTRDTCEALWLKQDGDGVHRPMAGDANSVVWALDQATRSKDGAGYTAEFETAPTDLSYMDPKLTAFNKYGEFLEVVTETLGSHYITVDIIWDGAPRQTVSFFLGTAGSALGVGMLGSMQLGGNAVVSRKKRITGGGRRVSFRGYNSGAGEDFAVSRFLLHFWVGDDRQPPIVG